MKTVLNAIPAVILALVAATGCAHPVEDSDAQDLSVAEDEAEVAQPCWTDHLDLSGLAEGLESPFRADYVGNGDGGLSHTTYFTMIASPQNPDFAALAEQERAKVIKVQASKTLPGAAFIPKVEEPGTEITGTLVVSEEGVERRQEIVFKLPKHWNGKLIVAGAPGLHSEFGNEAVIVPWLLKKGYAYVAGNKGLTNAGAQGANTLLNGKHPSQHWGPMMLDLARWAQARLKQAAGYRVARTYAVGLSNGGYQVRRALELDHERLSNEWSKGHVWERHLFNGGLDWSGVFWPGTDELDTNGDDAVSVEEFAAGQHFVSSMDRANLAMRYAYDPATVNTPAAFAGDPPYAAAQDAMQAAGFAPESAVYWGHHNTLYDYYKKLGLAHFRGVGYYNYSSWVYRAELRGDDGTMAAAYSPFPADDTSAPVLYTWLANAQHGGWNDESVAWALKNANTGRFSVPLITIHGDRDALLGLEGHALAYREMVTRAGRKSLHRLYVIKNGNHVDGYADGFADFDFDGEAGEEGVAALSTPMQPYAERSMKYLERWVELFIPPPQTQIVSTDPVNDPADGSKLSW